MTTETIKSNTTAYNPERLAWATMLFGLTLFILMCIGTIVFARWLVFESPTSMNVTLHVGQGTVGLLAPDSTDERAIRSPVEIDSSERMTTDTLSQGYIAFSDPYSGDTVVTVMLRSDSAATLAEASRPRFNMSENGYSIQLVDVAGTVEVWVSDGVERDIDLELRTALGKVTFTEKGNFLIETTADHFTITARDGNAIVTGLDGVPVDLAPSNVATVRLADPAISLSDGPIDLLPYSTFGTIWPKEWICAHTPDASYPNAPSGDIDYTSTDGRSTIHLSRLNTGPTPAETGCFQRLGENAEGVNVMDYDTLHLRVTFRVDHQSLSACGIAGSECPIMLHITYLDQNGNPREWIHGFYTEFRPSENGRRTCDTCWEPHGQINSNAWYTYDSGDMLNDWQEDLRPGLIKEIEFYASGHEYDVSLNEVALIATGADDTDDSAGTATSTP